MTLFRRAAPLPKKKKNPEKTQTTSLESTGTGDDGNIGILNQYKPLSDGDVPIACPTIGPQHQHLKGLTVSSHFETTESVYATAPNSLLTVEESVYKNALSSLAFQEDKSRMDELSLEQIQLRKSLNVFRMLFKRQSEKWIFDHNPYR